MKDQIRNEKRKLSNVKKLAVSGIIIAMYLVLMLLTQNFSFGQYQVRIATSIYSLAGIFPFLVLPLGIANLLSNTLLGGLGPFDMIGGFAIGIITSFGCFAIRRINVTLVGLPILLLPTLIVPIWLSVLLKLPYHILVMSIGVGQILPAILGILIVKYLEKPLLRMIQ